MVYEIIKAAILYELEIKSTNDNHGNACILYGPVKGRLTTTTFVTLFISILI